MDKLKKDLVVRLNNQILTIVTIAKIIRIHKIVVSFDLYSLFG